MLPLSLVLGALAADAVGAHRIAYYLVLLAVVGAAAAAFVAVADALEGKERAWLRGTSTSLSLVLLLAAAAARAGEAAGAAVPQVALSAAIAAVVFYALPLVAWLFEPVAPRRRAPRPARASAPARAEAA
ncbi:MAG TPA: hypothetical protein VGN27_14145 [Gaiellaceae bacterium]|nr:hypothetical protein [Gaiellaceae bacterium]